MLSWPSTLPQHALASGYTESYPNNMLISKGDAGYGKVRKKGATPPFQFSFPMNLTDTQLTTLYTFIGNLSDGVLRFEFVHPRTQAAVEMRMVPASDDELISVVKTWTWMDGNIETYGVSMTVVSLDAQRAMYAQETGDYPIFLLTITHRDLTEDIFISNDATTRLPAYTTDEQVVYGTVSNGVEYLYCPVDIEWISEEEAAVPQTNLIVYGVPDDLVRAVRSLRFSPSVKMVMVLASNTDNIEMTVSGLKFGKVDINQISLSGNLQIKSRASEPFPYRTCTPSTTSGIFK